MKNLTIFHFIGWMPNSLHSLWTHVHTDQSMIILDHNADEGDPINALCQKGCVFCKEPRLQPCRVGRVGCMQAVAGAGEGDGDGQADSKPCIVNQNETFKNWTKRVWVGQAPPDRMSFETECP